MKKAYLVLSNGSVFEGHAIGAEGSALGEMVFTTGVVGYMETLTDPCHERQIVMQTFPIIGNYGVVNDDPSAKCAVSGYVVRELCDAPSNFRSEGALDEYLKAQGVCGICGVDTREITRILRDEGAMNAMICTELPADMSVVAGHTGIAGPGAFARREALVIRPDGDIRRRVALIDFGAGMKAAAPLVEMGCETTLLPWDSKAEDIISTGYDGAVLSEGPGSPMDYDISEIEAFIGRVPVFGAGLGCQLAARAMGCEIKKLKYGHHGGNQPVRFLENGRTYITGQNHGYTVIPQEGRALFINANDGDCEGVVYPEKSFLGVLFTPQRCKGPNDTGFVYDMFMEMMGGGDNAQR